MTKRRSTTRAIGDITKRGLVARNCGARMFAAGMDWVTLVAHSDFDPGPWLSDEEREAYHTLLPGTWWAQWQRGWNDAAASNPGA